MDCQHFCCVRSSDKRFVKNSSFKLGDFMTALRRPSAWLFVYSLSALLTATDAHAQSAVCIENAGISELRDALLAGRISVSELTRAYLARIAVYDRAGPGLNARLNASSDS